MINILICSDPEAWLSNTYFFEHERSLTEYIMPEIKASLGNFSAASIEQIKAIPCIFTYEQTRRKDAYIGRFTGITIRQSNIKIDYELTGEVINFDDFIKLRSILDLGTWELNRTHWTIKNVGIEEIRPYFSKSVSQKPTVFVSYSWSPPENQRRVFDLVNKLTADGIKVIYDKNDLKPGQNKDYFMEQALTDHAIDKVLVICNQDYAEKANGRRGGVGQEMDIINFQLFNQPLQQRIIPIVIETNDKGEAYLPISIRQLIYIDLTQESGYDELIVAIKRPID